LSTIQNRISHRHCDPNSNSTYSLPHLNHQVRLITWRGHDQSEGFCDPNIGRDPGFGNP